MSKRNSHAAKTVRREQRQATPMPGLPAMALSVPRLMGVCEKLLARPAEAGDQRSAMICAHEVAYLWFGCLVGPR